MYSNKNKPSTFLKAKNETKIQSPKWVKSWVLKPQCGSLDQVPVWTRWGKNLNPGFFQSHWSQHWLVIGAKQSPFAFCLLHSITILKIFHVLVSIEKWDWGKTHFSSLQSTTPLIRSLIFPLLQPVPGSEQELTDSKWITLDLPLQGLGLVVLALDQNKIFEIP